MRARYSFTPADRLERLVVLVVAERHRTEHLADEVELLRRDRVRETDAERHLGRRGDRSVRRHRAAIANVGERRSSAQPDAAVERDAQATRATKLLVEDAHDLRRQLASRRGTDLRGRRRQVDARDHAETDVRRAARLEEPRLQVEADVADALPVELEVAGRRSGCRRPRIVGTAITVRRSSAAPMRRTRARRPDLERRPPRSASP